MPAVRASHAALRRLIRHVASTGRQQNEEDRTNQARNAGQIRHHAAALRRDDGGGGRSAARGTLPRRQGAGLCAGAQGALSPVEQLHPRRRRRDRPPGRGVQEGDRDRHHGREDQPERHDGPDHRGDRERQRRRRHPAERQPAPAVRQWSGRPQQAHGRAGGRPDLRVGARRRRGRRGRPRRAAVQPRQCGGLPQGRVRRARPRAAQHLGRLSQGRHRDQEREPAGRPDPRPHLRRRARPSSTR